MVIIVMGPAGSGKTTVGRALAADLGWQFVDADDHHSADNLERMRRGLGLDDAQREAWLGALHGIVQRVNGRREHLVLACSALKARYRDVLRGDLRPVRFVYLKAPDRVLASRLDQRAGHFAGSALLHSQLEDLEEPADNAITLDATKDPEVLVPMIRRETGN